MIERAQPLLGTTVTIGVVSRDAARAHRAIDAAFAAIAHVHARMSFHDADSDLSRLHRAAPGTRVVVDADTATVLHAALDLSAYSDGVFDVAVGAAQVARRQLPAPCSDTVECDTDWRDIVVDDDNGVCLRRRLWIDLGGIAKGHAVDRAIACLRQHGIDEGVVNAGGDLRTLGAGPHRVGIDIDIGIDADTCAVLELGETALATSSGRGFRAGHGPHLDGRDGHEVGRHACVSVVAARCLHADALTKVVLARGAAATPLLRAFDATAYFHDADGCWSQFGAQS